SQLLAPNWRSCLDALSLCESAFLVQRAFSTTLSLLEKIRFPETETLVRRDAVRYQIPVLTPGRTRSPKATVYWFVQLVLSSDLEIRAGASHGQPFAVKSPAVTPLILTIVS